MPYRGVPQHVSFAFQTAFYVREKILVSPDRHVEGKIRHVFYACKSMFPAERRVASGFYQVAEDFILRLKRMIAEVLGFFYSRTQDRGYYIVEQLFHRMYF